MKIMMETCRDTHGHFNASIFNLWTCTLCYYYLFNHRTSLPLEPNWNKNSPKLLFRSNFSKLNLDYVVANLSNSVQTDTICRTIQTSGCDLWKSCCKSAERCCQRQRSIEDNRQEGLCRRTWDGFGCFDDTMAGETATIVCPEYIEHGFKSGYARKLCTDNATWQTHPIRKNTEWTDYTPCLNIKVYKTVVYVGIACCGISILMLTPASIIFLTVRQLRTQQRIRLHLCLFLSFIMTSVVNFLWDIMVYNDRLDNPATQSLMFTDSWSCRTLYIMKRYTRTTNFFWMFCEGFYLHRLIVQAFNVPRCLLLYYLFGWGLPIMPVTIYVLIKAEISNGCWVKNIGAYEWIIYVPNLLCIVMNCLFLFSILRIMVSQLQTHPNEPSGYRRALKATFVLVPLFGIQIFLIIYRPHALVVDRLTYEIISKIIVDCQGALISLIFCYCNGEVHVHLRAHYSYCCRSSRQMTNAMRSPTVSLTQYSAVPFARSPHSSSKHGSSSTFRGQGKKKSNKVKLNGSIRTYTFN